MNHEMGGMGQTKGKATTQQAKQNHKGKEHSNGTTTHARSDHPLVNSRSPS